MQSGQCFTKLFGKAQWLSVHAMEFMAMVLTSHTRLILPLYLQSKAITLIFCLCDSQMLSHDKGFQSRSL